MLFVNSLASTALRLCLVGRREKWKEGVVDHLGEGDGEGGRGPFFHDVWYDKKERKQKSSILFGIEI